MTEAKLTFSGDRFFCCGFEIKPTMYGWHVLDLNGELMIGVSDIEDAVTFCLKKELSND
ncbi:hypothetical protein G9F32_02915 [Acinetobacter sp. 194]|uniref:hypothetical protein n=1 Tax=Acinetobacter shaoyimingii TaxID=2715164 RepID=UPI00140A8CC2|nr:hypothetical protein [Acinetobacter shaoyimingii]NHB56986.1 hypothetical protein [Acinetobacter shaoyimingii]